MRIIRTIMCLRQAITVLPFHTRSFRFFKKKKKERRENVLSFVPPVFTFAIFHIWLLPPWAPLSLYSIAILLLPLLLLLYFFFTYDELLHGKACVCIFHQNNSPQLSVEEKERERERREKRLGSNLFPFFIFNEELKVNDKNSTSLFSFHIPFPIYIIWKQRKKKKRNFEKNNIKANKEY